VATTPASDRGLSREALMKFDAAQAKTAWALQHRRRFALVIGDDVLARETVRSGRDTRSATRHHLWDRWGVKHRT
jgi:hypothetical protein